tara:strand:+ start:6972 stop:7181 length:210 start_codon:yes stop_codon:yes gene_type:complete
MNKLFNSLIGIGEKLLIKKVKENKNLAVEIINKNVNLPLLSEKEEAVIYAEAFDGFVEFLELLVKKLKK